MKKFIDDIKQMDKNQLILLAAKLKKELVISEKTEPIAVVGMGAKFPGQKDDDINSFWQMILDGESHVDDITDKRWRHAEFYSKDFDEPGKSYVDKMALLSDFDKFDAQFFNIHQGEADLMDPQQRWLLEVCWHALEDAGINPLSIKGDKGGVYLGLMNFDYVHLQNLKRDLASINGYSALGSSMNVASGRISYFYGLTGPSCVIDTACSSSLVSIHQACQALRNDECSFALAGGVNAILSPTTTIAESKAMMLSPTGACHTYDDVADGYARGEGCGILVLKKLKDAKADGDRIYGLIKGSAVNQNGVSQGITAPNGPSQIQVIRDALKHAQISPADVGFVETHGTGTPLGDPIEMQAICEAYQTSNREETLKVSSLKTNIGHTESAAGVAGLMKLLLARHHGILPKHNNLNKINKHIDLENHALEILAENCLWPEEAPFGAVSSFGFSGTNAHLVIAKAPKNQADNNTSAKGITSQVNNKRSPNLFLVSGKCQSSLGQLNQIWQQDITTLFNQNALDKLSKKAKASQLLRSHFDHRSAWVQGSEGDLMQAINISASKPIQGKLAWLFSDQINQYSSIAMSLYHESNVFKEHLNQCVNIFDQLDLSKISLKTMLFEQDEDFIQTNPYSAVVLYTLQVSLIAYWRELSLEPDYLIGSGSGEYAAAYCASIFSLEAGLKLLAFRVGGKADVPHDNDNQSDVHAEFTKQLAHVDFNAAKIPIIASFMTTASMSSKQYWLAHLSAVTTANKAILTASDKGVRIWLELGVENRVIDLAKECFEQHHDEHMFVENFDAEYSSIFALYRMMAQLFVAGKTIDWAKLSSASLLDKSISLPLYPFQKKRYWYEEEKIFQLSTTNESPVDDESDEQGFIKAQAQLLAKMEEMNQEEQWLYLIGLTRRSLGEVLNLTEEEVPVDIDLFDLGLDSMKALDMRAQVQKQLGFRLSATLVFDYPNVIKLVDYFGIELLKIWQSSPLEEEVEV